MAGRRTNERKEKHMTIALMAAAMQARVTPEQKFILILLAEEAGNDEGTVYADLKRVAFTSGYSVGTLQRIIHTLIELNVMRLQDTHANGIVEYSVDLDALQYGSAA